MAFGYPRIMVSTGRETKSARRAPAGLALTFDDGPDPSGTPAVLDALAGAGVRATFFVIAPRAARHRDLLRRADADGHRIALHCDRHVRHTELGEDGIRRDAERALDRLAGLDIHPLLWRVPWGVQAGGTAKVASELGLTLVGWDVDTRDWRGDTAEQMFASTCTELTEDAIVLAHDGIGPGARRTHCAQTAAYIGLVADHAARTGLSLAPL
jgi:peptidoglycan-N-acetylglucosamine deacetylase